MTISYNTNWVYGSYKDDLFQFVLGRENIKTNSYFDGSSIAIGIGYDLIQNTPAQIQMDLGLTLTAAQTKLLIEAKTATTARRKAIATELGLTISPNQAKTTFEIIANNTYEDRLNNSLGITLPPSQERIALFSMVYSGHLQDYKKIPTAPRILTELKNAISAGNRAEAWYVIRFLSSYAKNPINANGYANRAFSESELFGLYDPGTVPSRDEANAVYRMFTSHRSDILAYENTYAPPSGQRMTDELMPAATVLVDAYKDLIENKIRGGENTINTLNIQITTANQPYLVGEDDSTATGSNNDLLIGTEGQNNYLYGLGGNDVLIGGSGDDVLEGGKGNDVMSGGGGNDTYNIAIGDGDDVIEDQFCAEDKVIFHGIKISDFIRQQDGTLKSADGNLTGQYKGSDFVVRDTKNGGSVTLNADFQEGDFGIHFVDAPVDPITTLDITGDILPVDTDPDKTGVQAKATDQLPYNPLGTAQPYEDYLVGSDGNDHIMAGELNDIVNSGNAASLGGDWVEGGNGNDFLIGGDGADLIEGDAGSNVLLGEAGNDRLYANTKIDTSTAIDNGNNDTGSGMHGAWLNGGVGDDTLVAGADNDVLTGGAGKDLIIAGAGDDYIMGDADFTTLLLMDLPYKYEVNNWFFGTLNPDTFNWSITTTNDVTTINTPYTGENTPDGGADDEIYAGAGNDIVWGGEGNDIVLGEAGDDTIHGDDSALDESRHGNDFLNGGDGNDTLYGQGGDDILYGGAGNDKLFGDDTGQLVAGNNYMDGEDGDDTLYGGAGDDKMFGGAGKDKLYGGIGTDYLDGEDGNDVLQAEGAGSTLFGGDGDDELDAYGGSSYLDGEEGNNTLYAEGGNNTLMAGAGDDTLTAAGGNNYLDGGDGTNLIVAQDGGNNTLYGGAGNDTLSAGGGGNTLDGGEGTNTLIADGGNNTLISGSGDDILSASGGGSTLDAGDGNDTLIADGGSNTLYGGAGDDFLSAAGANNTLNGGEGQDTYAFDPGFGTVHIVDADFGNILQLNMAYAGSGIVFGLGSLKLSFANGDELHIDGFDPNDPLNTCAISTFQFSDQSFTLAEIIAMAGSSIYPTMDGADITGTDNADVITGTDAGEYIYGLAGNDSISAGAGFDVIEGGDGNDTIDGGAGVDIMQGGYGNDTYYVDNPGDQIIEAYGKITSYIDAYGNSVTYVTQDYETVNSTVSYTLGNNLENLNLLGTDNISGTGNELDNNLSGNDGNNILTGGAGDDLIHGGAGDDYIDGGSGNDLIHGGAGADVMAGGTGNDVYWVDNTGDTVSENSGEGIDNVESSVTFTLGDNIENLSLSGLDNIDGTGNELDNRINGNSGDNTLAGGAGNDTLNGSAGIDTLLGGTGDDTYYVDNASDLVVENLNEGTDIVFSSSDYTLSDNVENLSLYNLGNIATGNDLDNLITGNNSNNHLVYNNLTNIDYQLNGAAGNDTLTGNFGNDTLDGGSGADVMNGGFGDDTYYVDNTGDQVIEDHVGQTYVYTPAYGEPYTIATHDIDTVNATISYTLGDNLENLNLLGADNIDAAGNEQNNIINGNDGDNTLSGNAGDDTLNGGAGADVMMGGAGNDIYYVDNVGDQVIETVVGSAQWLNGKFYAGDAEQVFSSVDFTLGANLENLTLIATDNINGTGNELNNVIAGNAGDNLLLGEAGDDTLIGGGGNDTLNGGAGNDTYQVTESGVTIVEDAGNGLDQVYSSVDITLSANIENLTLNDGALIGAGNESGNYIVGNLADNVLSGEGGNDNLDGSAGNDSISGGDGNDTIYGGDDTYSVINDTFRLISNSDVLDGGAGDDYIDGGSGNDTISGGSGNDMLLGGNDGGVEGQPELFNNDVIDGGEGNDTIDGQSGADTLYGGAGDDVIYGGDNSANFVYDRVTDTYIAMSNDDFIDGGDGNDQVYGQQGNDILHGGAGDDVIDGGDGNDLLDGGTGNDTLLGGQGDDVYVVDGTYVKTADVPTVNDCGDTVLTEQLVWSTDSVIESGGNGYDTVLSSASYALTDNVEALRMTFDPAMMVNDPQQYADLMALGQNGTGNALDNIIVGSDLNNRLEGGLGDDTLIGGDGNDTLVGGQGNDVLSGGAGDDRYVFRLGDGADSITDNQGSDTLYIGSDLSLADIQLVNNNGDVVVSINGTGDSIVLSNWLGQVEGVSRIEFCDGTVLDRQGIAYMMNSPVLNKPLTNQITLEDNAYSFAIPADTFVYNSSGNGDTLAYSATMADGSALPAWLTLDAATGVFSGTPSNWDVSTLQLTVMATNVNGNSVHSNFILDVLNVNDAPTVVNPMQNQSVTEGQAFYFRLPDLSSGSSFLSDAGDTGTPLQIWPDFNQLLYGSGGNDSYNFWRDDGKVSIEDSDNSPMDSVKLFNVAPADIIVTQNQYGDVTLSVNGTSDSLTLRSWLASDAAKIEQVVFADGTVWGVSDIMSRASLAASAGNDYLSGTNSNDTIRGQAGDDAVMAGAGNDLVLGGAGNDWLVGGTGSDLLYGGSGADDIESDLTLSDTSNDLLMGGAGDDYLGGSISNDLLIGGQGNDFIFASGGSNVMLFNRGDGNDTVDSSSAGGALSLGGGIDFASLTFSRVADNLILNTGNSESVTFQNWFSANFSDSSLHDNQSVSRLQIVTEAMAGYDASSADPLLNKRIQQFDFSALANQFEAALLADPTITIWQLAPHLAEFSQGGSDTVAIGGDMAYLYGKNGNLDGLTEADLRKQLNTISFGTSSQILTKTDLAGPVFNDVDKIHGDILSYSATLADGSALPSWLSFDAVKQTFSGTPANGDAGVLQVAVNATDVAGLTATSVFNLNVVALNVPPTANTDAVVTDEDSSTTTISAATLLANDLDPNAGDSITIAGFDAQTTAGNSVTMNSVGDLLLDIGNNYQSLGSGQTATDSFSYIVTDTSGATSTATVDITINGMNDAPIVAIPLQTKTTTQDQLFNYVLPANSFTDIDNGDVLSYSATLADGSALPSWLSFDATTQTFSGTPGANDLANLGIMVTATDTGGLAANSNFTLAITPTVIPGTCDDGTIVHTLSGGDGNDSITYSNYASNTIDGGAGDDLIQVADAWSGDASYTNIIRGGSGNDRIVSGGSNDTYLFDRGDGQDSINDNGASGTDAIVLGAGISASDLTVSRSETDLILHLNDPANPLAADQITIENWFSWDTNQIESLVFADGSSLGKDQLTQMGNLLQGTDGADTLIGYSGSTVLGQGGDDVITDTARNNNNTLSGGDGNDSITYGSYSSNTIDGGAGDDLIQVEDAWNGDASYSNIIRGGSGNDRIVSGGSNDTYLFDRGDGQDSINDNGGTDTIVLGAGISAADLTVSRTETDLILHLNDPANPLAADQITIENWFSWDTNQIESLVFADGSSLGKDQLTQMGNLLQGTDGADTLIGYSGSTVLGQGGDDVITDTAWNSNNTLSGGDGNDSITYGSYSSNTIDGGAGDDLIQVEDAWNGDASYTNIIRGGSGNDRIVSGDSNDTYLFDRGDGQDSINDNGGTDAIVLGAGISAADLTVSRTETDLILHLNDPANPLAADQITIENWFSWDTNQIESLVFADGSSLGKDQLTQMAGTAGDDNLAGSAYGDTLSGLDGNDVISGNGGNDILQGGNGNDTLSNTEGQNLFDGGAGSDILTGNSGNELFIGGTGNDTIQTGSGADIIAFNQGDGQDTVVASTGADNTLSLGGGIQYANLAMSKSGNDLIFSTGNGDQITLQDWYAGPANHSVANLQIVLDNSTYNPASSDSLLNQQVQTFDFSALASSFDQAVAADATLTSWSMADALLTAHLASSDSAALGGDLANQYNQNGSLTGIGLASAQTVMNDASFGTSAQTLHSQTELQQGGVQLG